MRRDIRDELARLPPEYRLDISEPGATPPAPKPAPVEAPPAPVDAPPPEQADTPIASVEAQPEKHPEQLETMSDKNNKTTAEPVGVKGMIYEHEDIRAARTALEGAKVELAEAEKKHREALDEAVASVRTSPFAAHHLEAVANEVEAKRRRVETLTQVLAHAESPARVAEQQRIITKRREASARIRALTEQLTEQTARIDALITEAVGLIAEADKTEREISRIADINLGNRWLTAYFARVVGERLEKHGHEIKVGHSPGSFAAAAKYAAEYAGKAKGGWYIAD